MESQATARASEIEARLEYLRGEIEAERISYGEIAELQSLAEHIQDGDVVLLEWAGREEDHSWRGSLSHMEKTETNNQPRRLTPAQRGEAFSGSEAYAAGRMTHAILARQGFTAVQVEVVHDALMAAFQAGYLLAGEDTSVDQLLRRMEDCD